MFRSPSRAGMQAEPAARSSRPGRLLPVLFALMALPVVVLFALAVPVGEVPDEVAHAIRVDSVRRGELAGVRQPPPTGPVGSPDTTVVHAEAALLGAGFMFNPSQALVRKVVTRARLDELLAVAWSKRPQPIAVPNTAVYPPNFYIPAAWAMAVARRSGGGPFLGIMLARLVNGGAYVALGTLTLVLATRGRASLFALLCLPISLALAASVNQDGLGIACAGLVAALLTRRELWAWWAGAALFGAVAMAKPHLLPLALIVPAAVPHDVRSRWRAALAGLAVAVVPALAWAGAMTAFVATPFVRGPAQAAGPLYAGAPGTTFATTDPWEQLRVLLAAPARFVTLTVDSIWAHGEWLWREAIGVLGTLDVVLPMPLYDAWSWAVGLSVLAGFAGPSLRWAKAGVLLRLATAGGLIGAIWAVYILQYLSWTHVGAALVEGGQGRYLIPAVVIALPVAALAERPSRPTGFLRAAFTLPAVLVAVADVVILPAVVLNAYYVR